MQVINYSGSFRALDRHITAYNLRQESLSEKLRGGVILTAKELIRVYAATLFHLKVKSGQERLPALRTNSPQLATLAQVSDRTIRRHIGKLESAGVIVRRVFHGTQSDYELEINPDLLSIAHQASKESVLKKVDNPTKFQSPKTSKWTKCPLTDTGNIENNIVKAVDNCLLEQPGSAENVPGNALKRREPTLTGVDNPVKKHIEQLVPHEIQNKVAEQVLSGYTREKVTGQNQYPPGKTKKPCAEQKKINSAEEIITGNDTTGGLEEGAMPDIARETREKVQEMREAGAGGKSEDHGSRSTFLKKYCGQLWSLALDILYKDRFLTDSQLEAGERQIMKFYEPVSTEGLPKIHQKYVERIHMVGKFIAKDPQNRYVQLPDRYFSTSNPHGFRGTKQWYDKQQKRKQEVQATSVMRAQLRRLSKAKKKGSQKEALSLRLFRDCERQIAKLNHPGLLEEFYAAVIKPELLKNK